MSKRVPKYEWTKAREEVRSAWKRLCSLKWGRSPYTNMEQAEADLKHVRQFLERVEVVITGDDDVRYY